MNMHRFVTVALLLAALAPAQGRGQKSQDELRQLRTEKLAKEVFKKAPWLTDFDAAREQAKKEGKLLFTYFTRSYAG
jgi:high-affinity K+ transport system ATPase subunit B